MGGVIAPGLAAPGSCGVGGATPAGNVRLCLVAVQKRGMQSLPVVRADLVVFLEW